MSKAILVSALLAGVALLLAATFFQPSRGPGVAAPATPVVVEPGEEPALPPAPTRSAPSIAPAVDAPLPAPGTVREIPLVPHGSVRLSGYVRVGASERNRGEPMPDAVVRLVPDSTRNDGPLVAAIPMGLTGDPRDPTSSSEKSELGRAVTDERGRFQLETSLPMLPVPMSASLVAEKAGWSDATFPGGNLEVQPPVERDDLVAYLVPSLVLKGSVVDGETNLPIAGARVEAAPSRHPARDPGPPLLPCAATTDLAGRFRLDLGGARGADLLVSADGFLEGLVRVARGSVPPDLRIALAREETLPSIEGRVGHAGGPPCPEARLSLDLLRPLDGPGGGLPCEASEASRQAIWESVRREDRRADADGSFRILLPCGGTWMVKARCGGFGGKKSVEVPARGATACQVALEEDCRLRVRVVDEAGRPVIASVYLRRGGMLLGSTTVDGALEIGGVPVGEEVRISAEWEGRRSRELIATPRSGGEVFDVGTLAIPGR